MILKAGTYRWNDVLTTLPSGVSDMPYPFISNNISYEGAIFDNYDEGFVMLYGYNEPFTVAYSSFSSTEYDKGWTNETLRDFTFPNDYEVYEGDIDLANWYITNTNYNEVNGGNTDPTFATISAKIRSLISKSNAKTGESDADLTTAVDKLIAGYGTGGDTTPYYDGTVIIEKAESVLGIRRFKDVLDVSIATLNEPFTLNVEGVYLHNDPEPVSFTSLELNNIDLGDGVAIQQSVLIPLDVNSGFPIYVNGYMDGNTYNHEWGAVIMGWADEETARLINITKCDDETAKAWLLANTEGVSV